MKIIYRAVFLSVFRDGSGGYTVEFPDLPGCIRKEETLRKHLKWQQMLQAAGY